MNTNKINACTQIKWLSFDPFIIIMLIIVIVYQKCRTNFIRVSKTLNFSCINIEMEAQGIYSGTNEIHRSLYKNVAS